MDARLPETPSKSIISIELPLREDVGAEVADFLTLGLLGIDKEATDLAQTILWRHLHHFPVFAEVADYAVDKDNESLQTELLRITREQAIQFTHPNEQSFLKAVIEILDPKKQLSITWSSMREQMARFNQWSSPTLVSHHSNSER